MEDPQVVSILSHGHDMDDLGYSLRLRKPPYGFMYSCETSMNIIIEMIGKAS